MAELAMTEPTWQQIKFRLDGLLAEFEADLPADEALMMGNTIKAGEYHEFFDSLCGQLYEYKIFPSAEHLKEIQDAASSLKLGPESWDYLLELSQP